MSLFNSLTQGLKFVTVSLFLFSNLAAFASPQTTQNSVSAHEEWSGMYLGEQKIGYEQVSIAPTTYQGRPALRESTHSIMRLTLLGTSLEEKADSLSISDLKSQPLQETLNVTSGGSSIHIVANFDYARHKVTCVVGEGTNAVTRTIDIPAGANLAGDIDFATTGRHLKVGDKFELYTLNPVTITLDPVHVEVKERQEIVNEAGKKVPVYKTVMTMPAESVTAWLDAGGEAIKGEANVGAMRLVMTSESRQHALDKSFISPTVAASVGPAYAPPADLAVATSVAVNKSIEDPRKLKSLHAVMSGIPDKKLILSDERQHETLAGADSAPYQVDLQITAESPDPAKTAKLPLSTSEFAPYLEKAAYLNTDDPQLRQIAIKLRGDETDTYKIALTIRDWVHQNVTPDASMGVMRSASDVFGKRRGVCRDYATLYAALARIAGVPTRLCAGVVYADLNGKAAFFYHAWAESYVGQWVAVDPTLYDPSLGVDYVDATHIKFAEGDVLQMYAATTVVGKLRILIQ